jgi:hypothetical protein
MVLSGCRAARLQVLDADVTENSLVRDPDTPPMALGIDQGKVRENEITLV